VFRRDNGDDEGEEDEEDGDAPGAEDETEDGESAGGLLSRFNVVRGLGGILRRGGGDDDEEEDDDGDGDAPGAEDETEGGELAGGLLSRFVVVCIMVVRRLGDILRRGGSGDDDEDEDEDDVALPVAAAPAPGPQVLNTDGPAAVEPEPEVPVNAAAPQDGTGDSPSAQNDRSATGLEEASENGEKGLEPERPETQVAMSPAAMRLRELARSQEDVPVAELADDLQELLGLLGGRRR
jgi:hypothetical protein